MAKKLLLIVVAVALLLVGALAGIKYTGDNRATVVGDTSRYTAEATNGGVLTRSVGGSGTGAVHEVRDGDSIQAAVTAASEGDVIKVFPGRYSETVYIDKDNLIISGVIVAGAWPIMEGNKELNDAVLYSGNDITIENLQIQHYKGNAIMGQAGNNFLIRNNNIIDTGIYGIFPEFGTNGLVTHNVLSGIEDAAIYVGMCDNVHVTNNEVFDNVAGIEIENTRHSIVENNYVHDNTGGILVFITPGLPIKTTFDTIVRNNFIVNNNTPKGHWHPHYRSHERAECDLGSGCRSEFR
jgi:parallel beta-helix repeat protein